KWRSTPRREPSPNRISFDKHSYFDRPDPAFRAGVQIRTSGRGRTHAMAVLASPRNTTPTIPSCLAASELPSILLLSEPPPVPTSDAACHSRGAWTGHL